MPILQKVMQQKINLNSLKSFTLIFISFFISLNCSKSDFVQAGDSNTSIYTFAQAGISAFLAVDVNRDGQFDDYSWIRGEAKDPKKIMLLFNEMHKDKKVYARIWYGPGNLKLVEKSDLNADGRLESTVYFNEMAKPKVHGGHLARIETDFTNNGETDVWEYPGIRMEFDSNSDGKPDRFTLNLKNIQKNRSLLLKSKSKLNELIGKPLNANQSWALHPKLISHKIWRATIPFSL